MTYSLIRQTPPCALFHREPDPASLSECYAVYSPDGKLLEKTIRSGELASKIEFVTTVAQRLVSGLRTWRDAEDLGYRCEPVAVVPYYTLQEDNR